MSGASEKDLTTYRVVANIEDQYSIWPDFKEVPAGWQPVGKSGDKAACLAYIESVWTDMRPLSLRRQMDTPNRASGEADRESGHR